MVLTGAVAALWCPECSSVQQCKVLEMSPGFTRVTWAECRMCAMTFDPQASDQGEAQDHDLDHTPGDVHGE